MLGSSKRTETKSRWNVFNTSDGTSHYQVNGGGTTYSWNTPPFTYAHQEIISNDRGADVFWKNCYHRTINRGCSPVNGTYTADTYSSPSAFTRYYLDQNAMGYAHVILVDDVPYTIATDLEDLSSVGVPLNATEIEDLATLALRQMIPSVSQFSDGFSLANFIAEMRDIRTMFRLWSSASDILQNISGAVLNWELGWKPFLSDVEKIRTKIANISSIVGRWNEDAKNRVIYTRHANITKEAPYYVSNFPANDEYGSVVELQDTSDIYYPSLGGMGDHKVWSLRSVTREAKMIFHLYFIPKHLNFGDSFDKSVVYFDALGLGGGLSIPWEGIPFSFVVDYFLTVGNFLESFTKTALGSASELRYDIVDFGYSYKQLDFQSDDVKTGPYLGDPRQYDYGSFSYYHKLYVRRRMAPPVWRLDEIDWNALHFKMPSLKQLWIGLNLANVLR